MTIPAPVIAVVSRLLADAHTHDTLERFLVGWNRGNGFERHGAV